MAYSLSFFFEQCRDLQKVFGCMQILKFDFLWMQFYQRLGYVKHWSLSNYKLYTLLKSNYNSRHEGNKHIKIVKDVKAEN